ncbi:MULTISPECIES: GGDEF domain-containing protein [Hydrogenophaga]|uniref:diguanylate cyclase n=2 Tax=Hydrogenophaga TaxID=47420 RepID=A0ABW2QEL4_9BURK
MKIDSLHLDHAQALLARAGQPLDGPQGGEDPAYLQRLIDALCELSLRDPLTGLSNRRHFLAALDQEIDRVTRAGDMALLLLVDIDHFKRVNDTHGHPAGDQVIRAVAQCLSACVRPMDTVSRYGGEEFAIILPSCQSVFGAQVAERIRERVAATPLVLEGGDTLHFTVSIGGAYAPQWLRFTAAAWIERADEQLYRAKAEGRNRVCLEPQADSVVSAEEKSLLFGLSPVDETTDNEGVPSLGAD